MTALSPLERAILQAACAHHPEHARILTAQIAAINPAAPAPTTTTPTSTAAPPPTPEPSPEELIRRAPQPPTNRYGS